MQSSSAQVEPRATGTAAEGELGAERGYEKSLGAFAEEQSGSFSIQARQSTCLQLHSERSGFLRWNPYSGAMSGDEEGISALRIVSLCCFGPNFNVLACLSPRWQNYDPNRLHRALAPPNFSQQ